MLCPASWDVSITIKLPMLTVFLNQAFLFSHDEKFQVPGWRFDTSFILCTVSGAIALLCGLGLVMSALILPPEDGYEFLDDPMET